MLASVFHGPGDLRPTTVPDPEPSRHGIIIRVGACGICGSDLHAYRNGLHVAPGQIMGHEFAGTITRIGAEAHPSFKVGDRVMALPLIKCGACARCADDEPYLCLQRRQLAFDGQPGAFAELMEIPEAVPGISVFPLPDEVTLVQGSMIEPLAVALHATSLVAPRVSDTVAVLGLGMIGLGVVQALRARGVRRIVGVDPSRTRRDIGARLGADLVLPPDQHTLEADLKAALDDSAADGYDALIDCSSRPEMLATGIRLARMGGHIIPVSQYLTTAELDPRVIVNRGLTIRGSFAARARECAEALALIASGRVNTAALIAGEFPLSAIQDAFRCALEGDSGIKVLVTPSAGPN